MALDELDYDYNLHNIAEADKNLAIKFFLHPLQDEEASELQNRAIFVDTEFIEIRVRGDRLNTVQRPVREDDKKRFRAAYKAFKDGEEQILVGTPLKEWPTMTKSMLEELKYLGFHTVDQLAQASDAVCAKMAGLQTYKQKAITFLEYTKGAPAIDKLHNDMARSKNEAETLQRTVEAQTANITRMEAQIEALQGKKVK